MKPINTRTKIFILALTIFALMSIAAPAHLQSLGNTNHLPMVMRKIPPTPTPQPPEWPTPVPIVSTGNVAVQSIFYDDAGNNASDEYVEIKNNDSARIQLLNWTLRDSQNNVFTFPSYYLWPNAVCRVYTNLNQPVSCGFSYHSDTEIWENTGDCAFLKDSAGTLISQKCYSE